MGDEKSENEQEGLYFEEAPSEIPVTIRGRDGIARKFLLKEMNGEGLRKWMEITSGRVKRNKKGMPVGEPDFSEFHASLISLCLFDGDTGQPVPKKVVDGWKSSTQNALFNQCRKMNGLDEESEEKAKND